MSKRFNLFWDFDPVAFYLTFLSERFWPFTCNLQIISTRCTQNANMFFSFTQHTTQHFSFFRCGLLGIYTVEPPPERREEKRGGAPNFTQRIIDSEKKNFLFGWVRASFFGYKMAPTGAREPKTSLKFRR